MKVMVTFEAVEKACGLNNVIAIDVDHDRGVLNVIMIDVNERRHEGASRKSLPAITSDDVRAP